MSGKDMALDFEIYQTSSDMSEKNSNQELSCPIRYSVSDNLKGNK